MENLDIIQIIQDHSLTVRCLPHTVVSYWKYQEGDENKKYVDGNGKPSKSVRSVVFRNFDLNHFKNTKPSKFNTNTPEQRYKKYIDRFPNGEKLLKEERKVEKGGYWYVKETKNTDSMITFNREYDEFFAPTLKEAIILYLASIK